MGLRPHRLAFAAAAAAALLFAAPAAIGSGNGTRIVGGHAPTRAYPAQGAIYIESTTTPGTYSQGCGGTLVGSWQFLTAAHCVVFSNGVVRPADDFRVLLGRTSLVGVAFADTTAVTNVDVHSGYNHATHQNDVAMLRLATPSALAPMRVIRGDENPIWAPGVNATIIGWGRTSEGGSGSTSLLEANVPIRADSDCTNPGSYGPTFDPSNMLCAAPAAGGADTCQGDSGGPLMVPDGTGTLALVGVTSWGIGCARAQYPGIYSRLGGSLSQWLMERHPWVSFTVGAAHSGLPITFTASTFQPGPGGPFTGLNWDFDNNFAYNDASGGSVTRTFPTGGAFAVGVEASGGDRVTYRRVIVVNGRPTAEAGGPYVLREGGDGTFAGSGADPEGQALSFGWDLDKNGSYETAGANPRISAARTDGPFSLAVTLQVCDSAGGCTTDDATVGVTNVAPRANAGRDRRAKRRQRVRFRVAIADPGAGERFHIAWNCGNGRRATGRTATCRYGRRGRFTVRVTVTDDDGGRGADSVRVRVR